MRIGILIPTRGIVMQSARRPAVDECWEMARHCDQAGYDAVWVGDRRGNMTYDCAFCGEENEVLVDPGGGRRQTFTEDCAVCCRPNLISLVVGQDGDADLQVTQEYDA